MSDSSAMDETPTLAAREAEVVEEQHLDDRHATGEHYVSEEHRAIADDSDPLADVYRDDPLEAATDDPEFNLGRGIDNV